ncbi:Serine--tRNA ligase [Candidatus Portiera aleyrodidarum]|uniref:Serine--tRNA ligase n=1 Tax=Candidatus Portiera aleyrodidarum TV TaxID=1297582 RepID=A0A8D3X778_9GAMM|nr:serine--tRNA ligase [Candidatus Portiera aleyrodidarum]AGI27049.1 seryl-tRNA synthetase [Candidatus Portiera aleyrodidarum TV]CEI59009.1 Serine--tRNA ligase [Candidatus Portiera aleyrodidarum]
MLDLKLICNNFNNVVKRLSTRGFELDIKKFKILLELSNKLKNKTEKLQNKRNIISKTIGHIKKTGANIKHLILEVNKLNNKLHKNLLRLEATKNKFFNILFKIPNLPHNSVPIKKNIEIIRWGIPKFFNFSIRDHIKIGLLNDDLDLELATKITGSRFTVIRGKLAKLHRALIQFMLDKQVNDHGYEEMYVPYIINRNSLVGTGQLPQFYKNIFSIEGETEYFLIPTAEVPLVNSVSGKILNINDLPIKLTAHSPCFRNEPVSYGSDSRGMMRQHQFDKIELVQIVHPDTSYVVLEDMTKHAEEILKALKLPYRVIILCTEDISFCASKTYDIEVWIPSLNSYREISSISNCEDFQARRIKTRVRKNKEKHTFVHTLNGSGIAVGRCLLAIMENYQNEDGSITVPEILRSYMCGIKRI